MVFLATGPCLVHYITDIKILNYLSEGGAEGEDNYCLWQNCQLKFGLGHTRLPAENRTGVNTNSRKQKGVAQEKIPNFLLETFDKSDAFVINKFSMLLRLSFALLSAHCLEFAPCFPPPVTATSSFPPNTRLLCWVFTPWDFYFILFFCKQPGSFPRADVSLWWLSEIFGVPHLLPLHSPSSMCGPKLLLDFVQQ